MSRLFRRNGVWYVWLPKLGGGWTRKSTRCTDRRAAEAAQKQLERDAADPAGAAARSTTTAAVLADYARSRRMMGRSEATLRYVEQKAGVLVGMLPERAAELAHASLSRYVEQRLAQGAMRTTVRKELGVLAPALRLAKKNGKWHGDVESIIPQLDDDYRPRSRALTPWELVGLCSVLPSARAAHVAFIVATGARWGESVRAQDQDIREGERDRYVLLRGTKTRAARRSVPLPAFARSLFGWVAWHYPPGSFDDSAAFLPWKNVRRDLADACAKLGIPPVTPNDLRRTFGTWLREAGVEPQLIGAAMGHTTSRMVERVYGRLTPDALGKLLEERTGGDAGKRRGGEANRAGAAHVAEGGGRGGERGPEEGAPGRPGEVPSEAGGDGPARDHPWCSRPEARDLGQGDAQGSSPIAGRYVRCAPVVAATLAALNALHGPTQPRGISENDGAQGQNRTADTRIFNPRVDSSHVRDTTQDNTDTAHGVGDTNAVDWSAPKPIAGRERGLSAWWAPGIDPASLEFGPLHGSRAPFPLRAAAAALAAREM